MQEAASGQIVAALDAWRNVTEAVAERTFLAVYGSPTLQAAVGIDPRGTQPLRKAAKSPLHNELLQKRIAELKAAIPSGGLRAAVIRGILYAGITRGGVDERGFEELRRIREAHTDLSLSAVKTLVREQSNMLLIDRDAALAAIPSMLPRDTAKRRKAFDLITQVLSARGELTEEEKGRVAELGRLFGVSEDGVVRPFRQKDEERQAETS
jgi:hypothetical protein